MCLVWARCEYTHAFLKLRPHETLFRMSSIVPTSNEHRECGCERVLARLAHAIASKDLPVATDQLEVPLAVKQNMPMGTQINSQYPPTSRVE